MLSLIFTLVILGVALYAIEQLIPMSPPFPVIIRAIFGIFALILILQALGIPVLGLHTTL